MIGALAHYILIVVLAGSVVMFAGYGVAVAIARKPLGAFARAMVPVQAFALSTQSSLAFAARHAGRVPQTRRARDDGRNS